MSDYTRTDNIVAGTSESPGADERPSARSEDAQPVVDGRQNELGPRVIATDTLKGDDVVNTAGDKLGTLDDIILDVPGGRIAYAVLSTVGFLDTGDKLLAIPWRALTLDPESKCFILDVSKERFERAPKFDKDHWPAIADKAWAREVHTYYRARPYYWE
ncbi:MAG: PRC-barrel domain-containing protein [Burkholderiales bacterium]